MRRGAKIIGSAAMLSVAACGGEQGRLEIRPIGTPLAAGSRAVPLQIAEARGQFALGNIALALEGFRMALREDPNSVDAMTGVAACYDRMARYDLSRRHYEAALAVAPGDPQLLAAFAASLDMQGHPAEAASVRQEIQQRVAAAAVDNLPKPAAVAPTKAAEPVRRTVSVERAVPPPAASAPFKPVQIAAATPAPVARVPVVRAPIAPAPVVRAPVAVPKPVAATPAIGRSVTVALPPARPVSVTLPWKPAIDHAVTVALPPARSVPVTLPWKPAAEHAVAVTLPPAQSLPVTPPAMPAVESVVAMARVERDAATNSMTAKSGPRLERMSMREIALITVPAPQWRPVTVGQTQRSATVRFVPLRQATMRLSGVRLLNAARVNRLAARTRSYLVGRGWSPMIIGDAPKIRARSVIYYPPERRRTAERLSAQFGFVIAQRPGTREILVLLGRDAARYTPLRARG